MQISDHKISIQPDFVLVERPPGYEVDLNELPLMLMELANFCEEADCRKVLVVGENTKVNLEVIDIFDLGSQLAELHLQIAMVESHDASDENVGFLENVAFNRGGQIRFFDTKKDAKYWLGVS